MLSFNTGRMYSPKGQPILAKSHCNGVLFRDLARNIHGFISNCRLDQNAIMAEYDNGNYEYCGLAANLQIEYDGSVVSPANEGRPDVSYRCDNRRQW